MIMIMTIVITIVNHLLLSNILTVFCNGKIMCDHKNLTFGKLLNSFEP